MCKVVTDQGGNVDYRDFLKEFSNEGVPTPSSPRSQAPSSPPEETQVLKRPRTANAAAVPTAATGPNSSRMHIPLNVGIYSLMNLSFSFSLRSPIEMPEYFKIIKFEQKVIIFGQYLHMRDRGEVVLRKHLRTFEENQISNVIRRTKSKRKFHQFYNIQRQKIPERIRISLENHSSPTENSKKTHLSQQKIEEKNFENIFDGLQ